MPSILPVAPCVESCPPVKIYTLGRFDIEVGDSPVSFGRKLPKRPLALLKFLLARRGRTHVAHVLDALWPHEDADLAANAMDAALHRLRRLLGGSRTILLQDGQLRLNRALVWVDAFAFEAALDAVTNSDRSTSCSLPTAVEGYFGHFLPSEYEPWALSARERLRSAHMRAVMVQGGALEAAWNFDAAAGHYARAIDADDLVEAFYQGLMRCQLELKRRSEGLATYERLQRTLAAELGLQPAADSARLHQLLRAG